MSRLFILFAIQAFALLTQTAQAKELPYLDDQFACTQQADAQKYINDFGVDVDSFGGIELCRAQVDSKKLFNDLSILQNGQYATDSNNILIGGFVPSNDYYGWLKSQTRGMNRGNDIPTATAYNRGGYFTMQDGWSRMSTLGRVGVLVHEARHSGGYYHVSCNQGSYAGTNVSGCDTDYTYGGSHAVEMEYYARTTVDGQNFHPVYQKMARLMAMARANFVFNKPVLKKREALLAWDQKQNVPVLFDGNKAVVREPPKAGPLAGVLKRTSFGAVQFDGLGALAIELYKNTGFNPVLVDSYSYFKMLLKENTPQKDVEEYDIKNKRYLVRITGDNLMQTYKFGVGNWSPSTKLTIDYARSSTAVENDSSTEGYFLIDTQGKIYPYDGDNNRLKAPLAQTWDVNNVRLVRSNGELFALKNDGRLYRRASGQWSALTSEANVFSDLVTVPLYDAFLVNP